MNSLFRAERSFPCGGRRRLRGCGVGGGRHVDDELGEDVRRKEVDADDGAGEAGPADARRLGAPLLRALVRAPDQRLLATHFAKPR